MQFFSDDKNIEELAIGEVMPHMQDLQCLVYC